MSASCLWRFSAPHLGTLCYTLNIYIYFIFFSCSILLILNYQFPPLCHFYFCPTLAYSSVTFYPYNFFYFFYQHFIFICHLHYSWYVIFFIYLFYIFYYWIFLTINFWKYWNIKKKILMQMNDKCKMGLWAKIKFVWFDNCLYNLR